jgi:CRP-like cAMP-binding protein
MTIEIPSPDASIIRTFFPLCNLPQTRFNQLCQNLEIKTAKPGEFLFQLGQQQNQLVFILAGKVCLQLEEFKLESIQAGTESARFALAHQIPRKVNACAEIQTRYICVNVETVKMMQQQGNISEDSSEMIVEEHEENDQDWMTTLLKSPIFRALPPANLQRIIMNLKAMDYAKGDTIIKQGEAGDFYYLIKHGECLLLRQPSAKIKPIKLGELKAQDTFGEDAIISEQPRSVSVIAKTDVSVLRLDKDHFIELIKKPSLKFINLEKAQQKVAQGGVLIDLRSPDEFNKYHLDNSINIPFFSLRMHLNTLDRKQPCILVCEDGKISEAAAFLLLRKKFDAWILEGGLTTEDIDQSTPAPDQASFSIDDGMEMDVKTLPEAPDAPREEQKQKSSSEPVSVEALQQRIDELEQQCARLQAEKNTLQQKYQQLWQKIEQARKKNA